MALYLLSIIGGFIALIWGADRFVIGAAALARNLGVAPLIIGLTIVGFGTSAPEMLVSAIAAWQGNPGLAIGNAIGSNITNIGLILGTTALIAPLRVHSRMLGREFPVLVVVMMLSLVLLSDGVLGRLDGLLLLLGLAGLLGWVTWLGLAGRADPLEHEFSEEIPTDMRTLAALFWVAAGLAVLLLSSRLLVWGAVHLARAMGISDLVIGLTIVALGTSLPELAASIMSALRHEHDIAVGNVVGSNLFNLLAVLGLPGIIAPGPIDPAVLTRDYPWMFALTVAVYLMAIGRRGNGRIDRLEGLLLLAGYLGYQALLYFAST